MENRSIGKLSVILCVLVVVSLACSFSISSTPTVAPPPPQTQAPVTQAPVNLPSTSVTTPSVAAGAVSNLQDVQKAVIQIESQGTFVDPQFGEYLGAGRGSGFIIDPSGLAVTNNHVVTGAGLLKVWVGGDTSKTYNAKVVGVSECSDLAVIQIEGEGFPYLAWFQGSINVGMDMYIAGFPLGEPEYTLTKGVISKAKANGMTAWSSIDAVIEYDATSNPGNSGGPVIDNNGQVIAVHYWGNSQTRQARGISRDVAIPTVEKLRSGNDIDTIGINGQAVSNEDGSVYGIWVSSVQPGSPADKAGIKGGDLLTSLGDLPMAADGTMGTYCDVLRSHKLGETINIKLVRWASSEVMEGQINGRELAVVSNFQGGEPASTEIASTEVASTQSAQVPGTTVNQNASQPGDVYYSTEFDSAEDWTYVMVRGNESGFKQSAQNGKFRIEILKGDTYVYFVNNAFTYTDVQLDTRVDNLGQNTNYTGLFCRWSDEGWYEANILNSGIWYLYIYYGKSYHLIDKGGSNLINRGREVNEYTFVCKGDELTLGINGVEARKITTKIGTYPLLREGQAGIFVTSTDVYPLLVEYDWFKASVPN